MRLLNLTLKDIKQVLRERRSAFFLVLMPVAFMIFFGLIIGGGGGGDFRLPVGLVNHDQGGLLSANLKSLLDTSTSVAARPLKADEENKAGEMVRDGELAAAIIIPAGYSEQMLAGQTVKLDVIIDRNTSVGQTASNGIGEVTTRLAGELEIARLSAQAFEQKQGFKNAADRQAYITEAITLSGKQWANRSIALKVEQSGQQDKATNSFNQVSPGMMVQFAIWGLTTSAMLLVLERKTRTLQRLLTTPIRPSAIIAGHVLAMFLVVFFQELVMVAISQIFFKVDYLHEPLGSLLMMVVVGVWVSCLGLFIGAMARGEDQAIMFGLIAMFVFSILGGAWFPLEVTGEVFSAIGHLTPAAWAMDGFQNIVLRNLGLSSVLLPCGILLGYAVLFFGLAIWRFRFE